MDIGLLNEKVTFQKNTVITDSIGNHKNGWEDFYTCHTTIWSSVKFSDKIFESILPWLRSPLM